MINHLAIRNFKCLRDETIPFKSLTFFCGLNGTGKSSTIQSLLMLRQSWENGMLQRNEVILNGELVHLGNGQDILFEDAQEDRVGIILAEDSGTTELNILYEKSLDLLSLENKRINRESTIFSNNFQYINAERLGPRLSSEKEDYVVLEQRSVGVKGEFTASFMKAYGKDPINYQPLCHPNASSNSLKENIEAWLREISPGVQIQLEEHTQLDQVSTIYSFETKEGQTNKYRPTNVGFGISYTLPVIVSLLAAKPNDLIIIENPEAHLHPRGQRKIGELISRACASGIQVVLETHSDHILNGIRISIKEGVLNSENAAFNYFFRDSSPEKATSICHPQIDRDGRFESWPDGFFDEWDSALRELL